MSEKENPLAPARGVLFGCLCDILLVAVFVTGFVLLVGGCHK